MGMMMNGDDAASRPVMGYLIIWARSIAWPWYNLLPAIRSPPGVASLVLDVQPPPFRILGSISRFISLVRGSGPVEAAPHAWD